MWSPIRTVCISTLKSWFQDIVGVHLWEFHFRSFSTPVYPAHWFLSDFQLGMWLECVWKWLEYWHGVKTPSMPQYSASFVWNLFPECIFKIKLKWYWLCWQCSKNIFRGTNKTEYLFEISHSANQAPSSLWLGPMWTSVIFPWLPWSFLSLHQINNGTCLIVECEQIKGSV